MGRVCGSYPSYEPPALVCSLRVTCCGSVSGLVQYKIPEGPAPQELPCIGDNCDQCRAEQGLRTSLGDLILSISNPKLKCFQERYHRVPDTMAPHYGGGGSHPLDSYLADRNDSRLPSRLAQQSRLQTHVPYAGTRPGPATSMLLSGNSSLAALTQASTVASLPSASSAMGGRALGPGRILAPDGYGGLQIPALDPMIVFECPFQFNRCLLTFTDYHQWFNHSLTHFGRYDPPKRNECCFCGKKFNETNGMTSWKKRMEEIASHHQLGHRLAHARPDFELFKYLWDKRLIEDAHYKNLMGAKGLSAYSTPPTSPNSPIAPISYDSVYTVTHNGRARGQGGRGRR